MEATTTSGQGSAGWQPDPYGRYEFRYFNGQRWTSDVAVDGVRYVDQAPAPSAGPAGAPAPTGPPAIAVARHPYGAPPKPPGNGKAILSFLFGLGSVLIGWTPFFFVVGAGAAIAAIVLGIVVLRGRPTVGKTRGFAIAGLILAPIGLALCVVGAILTAITWREIEEYEQPGPYAVEITDCSIDNGMATMTGTITNQDDRSRGYVVLVEFVGDSRTERDDVHVPELPAGDDAVWTTSRFIGSADVDCRIRAVNGPYPFGLDMDT